LNNNHLQIHGLDSIEQKSPKTTYFKHQPWTWTYKHINSIKFNILMTTHQLGARNTTPKIIEIIIHTKHLW